MRDSADEYEKYYPYYQQIISLQVRVLYSVNNVENQTCQRKEYRYKDEEQEGPQTAENKERYFVRIRLQFRGLIKQGYKKNCVSNKKQEENNQGN